jgi:Zn-dependent protease
MNPVTLLLKLPAILLAITVHEYAHGRASYRLGDPTARMAGRLTLNPLRHLDPMGFICLLLAGFGWAKPVPVNTAYFANPARDMMLSSAAGPVANLLAAVGCGLLFDLLGGSGLLGRVLALGIYYNIVLGLFNLLPVPPLDGSHVLKGLLPRRMALGLGRYDRPLMYGLFGVILLDALFQVGIIGRLLMRPTLEIFQLIGGREALVALVGALRG